MAERDEKDFAIEFGEYMAKAAEQFRDLVQTTMPQECTIADHWHRLNCAIYEFRKRAAKVKTN